MKASETTAMPTLQQVAAIVCGLRPEAELEWMERNMPRKVERAKEILALLSRSPVKDAAPAPVLTEEEHGALGWAAKLLETQGHYLDAKCVRELRTRLTAPQPEEKV